MFKTGDCRCRKSLIPYIDAYPVLSSAGVLKSAAGVRLIYTKYNEVLPPIIKEKIYILSILVRVDVAM